MKKLSIPILSLLILIPVLTACSSSSSLQPTSTATDGTLSTETQLIVGTLKLDGTQQAVTSEQAKELLPMWQVYQDISTSDTSAQEEVEGLLEQIQETMTDTQMQAISAMNLTQQDVFALLQSQNISASSSSGSSQSSSSSGASFGPPDGGMPGGAPPDMGGAPTDGGGMPGGTGGATSSTSTGQTQSVQAGQGQGGAATSSLINTLIQYLEKKSNA